ncbi:MAG: spermidine synthase [Candidatus Omnitrophica bacterium]|nr:spermidine synthase [Candidatus Omnitrophota bacterium]
MVPWILLDKVSIPGSNKELRLYQRDAEYSIKINADELMNSRVHNSEDALARLACPRSTQKKEKHVLIGGLGMGFTLRAALNNLSARTHVTVAELMPAVVQWNRSFLASLAGNPLTDKRVTVYEGDVADKISTARDLYDAILLDVDNGPQGLTQKGNDGFYTLTGLKRSYAALRSGGVLAIWSADPDATFAKRLHKAQFDVEETRVRTHKGRKGDGASVVWIAIKKGL